MMLIRFKYSKDRRAFYNTFKEDFTHISIAGFAIVRSKSSPKTSHRLIATERSRPPLRSLVRIADLFGIGTRKSIKAMAGDYDVEIRRLRRERRNRMARWNVVLAWGTALGIVLRSPVTFVMTAARKFFSGG